MSFYILYADYPYFGQNDVEMELIIDYVPLIIPFFPRVCREIRFLIENCLQYHENNRLSWD